MLSIFTVRRFISQAKEILGVFRCKSSSQQNDISFTQSLEPFPGIFKAKSIGFKSMKEREGMNISERQFSETRAHHFKRKTQRKPIISIKAGIEQGHFPGIKIGGYIVGIIGIIVDVFTQSRCCPGISKAFFHSIKRHPTFCIQHLIMFISFSIDNAKFDIGTFIVQAQTVISISDIQTDFLGHCRIIGPVENYLFALPLFGQFMHGNPQPLLFMVCHLYKFIFITSLNVYNPVEKMIISIHHFRQVFSSFFQLGK
ncbi:hypothetical protein D3C85_1096830 [compost metagenome]